MPRLIIDDREKEVRKHIDTKYKDKNVTIKRLTVGDFAIIDDDSSNILACIERKNLKDYAAGMRDGRYENISKMINLRTETKCGLYFIIEAKRINYSADKTFGGIKFSQILASIDLLTFRSNISVFWSVSSEHTATRLFDFVSRFDKIKNDEIKGRVSESLRGVTKIDEFVTEIKVAAEPANEFDHKKEKTGGALAKLTEKQVKTDSQIMQRIWDGLDSISFDFAGVLVKQFTVRELIKSVSVDTIKKIKNQNGRKPTQKAIRSLLQLKEKNVSMFTKILGGIPGVSENTAKKIMEVVKVDTFFDTTDDLGEVKIDGKRLGKKMDNVKKFLNFKEEKNLPSVVNTPIIAEKDMSSETKIPIMIEKNMSSVIDTKTLTIAEKKAEIKNDAGNLLDDLF